MTLEQFKVLSMLTLATMVVLFVGTVFVIYCAEKRRLRNEEGRDILRSLARWRLLQGEDRGSSRQMRHGAGEVAGGTAQGTRGSRAHQRLAQGKDQG